MMKHYWIHLLWLVLKLFSCFATAAKWNLIWSDEFDGHKLDSSNWAYDVHCKPNNYEQQCYTDKTENVRVENGLLVIDVQVGKFKDRSFTSGRIRTKRSWTYGKFEVRARLPRGHHLWPAIWLLPKDRNTYGDWAASGEIDMMEARGDKPNVTLGNLHYGGNYPHSTESGSGDRTFPMDFSRKFHKFTLEWKQKSIHWYIDDTQFHQENINRNMWSGKGRNPYNRKGQPFDKPFYLILNVAVGGTFFGPGPYVTPEEAKQWLKPTMEVDYVRVWEWK